MVPDCSAGYRCCLGSVCSLRIIFRNQPICGWNWTIINFFFIGIVAAYLVSNDLSLDYTLNELKLSILLAIACVLRLTIDYVWCRDLYFPKAEEWEFRIADTFTDSLARLTGDEQKAVKTTAFDLQMNPAIPG